eukprot:10771484-Ditylum_brightwellii.AAC.1
MGWKDTWVEMLDPTLISKAYPTSGGILSTHLGLLQHLPDGKGEYPETRHVVIPLLGEFKGERGEQWHLLLLSDVTSSGFKPQLWTEQ